MFFKKIKLWFLKRKLKRKQKSQSGYKSKTEYSSIGGSGSDCTSSIEASIVNLESQISNDSGGGIFSGFGGGGFGGSGAGGSFCNSDNSDSGGGSDSSCSSSSCSSSCSSCGGD